MSTVFSLSSAVIFFVENAYLEELHQTYILYIFSVLDVMTVQRHLQCGASNVMHCIYKESFTFHIYCLMCGGKNKKRVGENIITSNVP